ncbi:FKBP12-rapamycin complex-associated protein FK506-binding protein 12-rapamycin complex-associated protein 1 [Bacillus velezensis CAU B946]|nr:FKBP12-rapamycin complex-associated protein FK506-binding protein 12-rapamycin complex-associated protein 1 [Bacillus velezensis CAU B946]
MESGRKNVKLSLKEQWLSNQKSKYLNSTAAQKKPFKKFRRKRSRTLPSLKPLKKEPEAAEKEPEAVHNAAPEEKVPPKRVKKPMSRMSILEKIDFLTKLPHNMPRTLCLIEANGKTYRGVIVGRKNNAIFLRTTSNGAPAELAIDDITSLHPLGF